MPTFHCTNGCQTGILLRAEKTAQGMKGIYVSLTEGDVATYRVTLGPDGQELTASHCGRPAAAGPWRRRCRTGGAGARGGEPDVAARSRCRPRRRCRSWRRRWRWRPSSAPKDLPMTPPRPGLHPGEWNEVEVMIDANTVRSVPERHQ